MKRKRRGGGISVKGSLERPKVIKEGLLRQKEKDGETDFVKKCDQRKGNSSHADRDKNYRRWNI
jgi:hypothetical protein